MTDFEAWLDEQTWTIDGKNAARAAWAKAQDEMKSLEGKIDHWGDKHFAIKQQADKLAEVLEEVHRRYVDKNYPNLSGSPWAIETYMSEALKEYRGDGE